MINCLKQIQLLAIEKVLGVTAPVQWAIPARLGAFSVQLVSIGQGHEKRTGFGVDKSFQLAAKKACMEAIEIASLNAAALKLGSRTGVAAHVSRDQAEYAAFQELVERDAFLFHWLSETPGRQINPSQIQEFLFFKEYCKKRGEELFVIELESKVDSVKVALVASKSSQFLCWQLGLGAGEDIISASSKALREWVGNVYLHEFMGGCRPIDGAFADVDPASKLKAHHLASKQELVSTLLDSIVRCVGSVVGPSRNFVGRENFDSFYDETQFYVVPSVTRRTHVVLARNEKLIPLLFGDDYRNHDRFYRDHLRLSGHAKLRFRFHSENLFLPHPMD